MKDGQTRKLVISALCVALAFLLPFLTGQIPQIGSMLSPMHIPVLLCGLLCGWPWGLAVGFVSPLLRSLILGMPPLMPMATAMAFEMAAYGLVSGLIYAALGRKKRNIYIALIAAMLVGRAVFGLAMLALMGLTGGSYTFAAFLSGAFIKAWPGIILHILIIPPIVMAVEKIK